jgi:NTE family protein
MFHTSPTIIPAACRPPLAVALQGGGAYGAFTWGVLDRLLETGTFHPEALSGASAGAVNAVALAHGLLTGGPAGARETLRQLWGRIGQMPFMGLLGSTGAQLQLDLFTRVLSPYQFNPLNINPLRDALTELIDFEAIRRHGHLPLFVSATNVESGEARIFRENEISIDVVMASTCLPHLHHSVDIDGASYWDGGFAANPPILPLVTETACRSLLAIKLTPDMESGVPTTASGISARLRHILCNATLLRDLHALAEIRALLGRTPLLTSDLRRLRDLDVRVISISSEAFGGRDVPSSETASSDLLTRLFEAGRAAAETRLETDMAVAS